MTELITIGEANDHLRLDLVGDGSSPEDFSGDPRYVELVIKIAAATEAVLDYVSSYLDRESPGWDVNTSPATVRAATLLVLAWMWEHRGDDDAPADGYLTAPVKALLHRYRDLVCA